MAAGEPPSRLAKAGDYFDFQYPQGWKYQPFEHSAVVESTDGGTIRAHYAPKIYDIVDGGEVLRKLAGQMPDLVTKRLQHKARPMGGIVAHTWVLKLPQGKPSSVIRVYVVPLASGGAALLSGVYSEEFLKRSESVLDSIAGTVKGAERAAVEPLAPPAGAVASSLVHGTPALTPTESNEFAREWTAKLTGSAWYSDGRTLRLNGNGRYDSPQGPEGTWRVVIWESRPHLALSTPSGQPVLIRCHELKRVL